MVKMSPGARQELHAILDAVIDMMEGGDNDAGSGALSFGGGNEGLLLFSRDKSTSDYVRTSLVFRDKLRAAVESAMVANAVGEES